MTESSPLGVLLIVYSQPWPGTTGWAPEVILPRRRIRFSSQLSLSKTRVSCIAITTPTDNTLSIAIQIIPDKQLFEVRRVDPNRNHGKSYAKGADKHTAAVTRDVRVTTCTASCTRDDYILHVYNRPRQRAVPAATGAGAHLARRLPDLGPGQRWCCEQGRRCRHAKSAW